MRPFILALAAIVSSTSLFAQAPREPQTARQALIEMFFGQSADHLEKHLPKTTQNTLQKLNTGDGQNFLTMFSTIAAQAKASGANFETFETGSTLLKVEDTSSGAKERVEVTVENDDLSGDEDQIEVALHMTRNGKEDTLPFVPRFTFAMKSEADVWRLNEISVTVHIPLADPDFLKGFEERQNAQSEQLTIWSVRSVNTAEASYKGLNGGYACDLATLGKGGKQAAGANRAYLYDQELSSGKKNGYIFVISGCDGSHYNVVAEPATPGSGQRALCSNESGTIRASGDGKATTCLSSGEEIQSETRTTSIHFATEASTAAQNTSPSQTVQQSPAKASASTPVHMRVRVSQAVAQGMVVSKVQPVFPPEAKAARVQGTVVVGAIIGIDGTVDETRVVSSASPLLEQAALDAVKQWKYRPYLLNGNPVEVDTTIAVTFTLTR